MWWLWLLVFALMNAQGTLQQRAQSVDHEATMEVSSNLKVVGVYGVRENTTSDLRVLKITLELSAGALPVDIEKLIVRYSDGSLTQGYAWTDADVASDPGRPTEFTAIWIRGEGGERLMQAGDLVQLELVAPQDLPERTYVSLSLIPETGSPVQADFRTPPTYSSDTVITLR